MSSKAESTGQMSLFTPTAQRSVGEYREGTISLRDELKDDIPSTTYLTHAIHNVYPAKFIPQVPRFVIKTFNLEGRVILDPFAGSGTTAVESLITHSSSISNDIYSPKSSLVKAESSESELGGYCRAYGST